MREKDLLRKLSNKPFIVDLLATFSDKDYLYFVFEYCQYGTLSSLVGSLGRLSEELSRVYAA